MEIVFWGVRGAIPSPGAQTAIYGGNTTCLELYFSDSGRLIIIDSGSGIRGLGAHLLSPAWRHKPIEAELFFSHTHSDHIIGFPFFAPLYVPGTKLRIYGPATYDDNSLQKIIAMHMSYHNFPVRLAELAAKIEYGELKEGTYELGNGITVRTRYLNHPLLCLGYRFEHQGRVFCTAFDTEPYRNLFAGGVEGSAADDTLAREGEHLAAQENRRLEEFFAGADLLVYDAQYLRREYEASRLGWGHSAIEHAIEAAQRAQVKRLALFHHDPDRTDAQLDALAARFCKRAPEGGMDIFFAREGLRIDL